MGSYTQIASLGATMAARRRRTPAGPEVQDEVPTEAAFCCPRCGDTSIVQSVCERCRVVLRDPSTSVAVTPREIRPASQVPVFLFLAGLLAIPVLTTMSWPGVPQGRSLEGPVFGVVAALCAAMVGLCLLAKFREPLREAWSRRRWLREMRAVPMAAPDSELSDRVRFEGTVRIVKQPGGGSTLWLDDEARGKVRVPVEAVSAFSDRGPRSYLRTGDRVMVVARARVAMDDADGYRDERCLELAGDEVCVFVRSTGGVAAH